MIFFLYGPDTLRSRGKLKTLKEKFVREVDQSGLNLTVLNGADMDLNAFNQAVRTPPFLARKRMVVVENLIGKNKEEEIFAEIVKFLEGKKDEEMIIVFWEEDILGGNKGYKKSSRKAGASKSKKSDPGANPLFQYLVNGKYVEEFNLLLGRDLANWAKAEIKNRGGKINDRALDILVSLAGDDPWQLSTEIDKLIAYADGKIITEAEVTSTVKGKFDLNIFNLVDALGSKNKKLAVKLLSDQFAGGANEMYLLTMLVRQFRILLQIKELQESEGASSKFDLATKLDLHPFVAEKAAAQARNYKLEELKNIYNQFLNLDLAIKTSGMKPRVLFDLLVGRILVGN